MSNEEGPDDMMTLDQYLEEVRRKALIRKGSHYSALFLKKGRLEFGNPSSYVRFFPVRFSSIVFFFREFFFTPFYLLYFLFYEFYENSLLEL